MYRGGAYCCGHHGFELTNGVLPLQIDTHIHTYTQGVSKRQNVFVCACECVCACVRALDKRTHVLDKRTHVLKSVGEEEMWGGEGSMLLWRRIHALV